MFHADTKQAVMFPFEVRDPEDRKFFIPDVILAWAKQENYRIEVDNYDRQLQEGQKEISDALEKKNKRTPEEESALERK